MQATPCGIAFFSCFNTRLTVTETDDGLTPMDAASTDYGYHLGWETSRNAYTFFGYLVGQSNDDEIYIDLERVETPRKAKATTATSAMRSITAILFLKKARNVLPQ